MTSAKQSSALSLLLVLSLFGWAIKQVINVIQVRLDPFITSVGATRTS